MPRVLITGGAGLLGRALIRLAPPIWEVHATRRQNPVLGAPAHDIDLADSRAVQWLWENLRPDLVVHTAYGTANGERDIVVATQNVASGCAAVGARLIHVSTDLVFDGESGPYSEGARLSPILEYGRWKARAEDEVRKRLPEAAMVRTSLIIETEPPDPRTAWVRDALHRRQQITLYVDEIRSPITSADLALQLWEVAELPTREAAGVWHLVAPEALSRYALGLLIAARFGLDPAGITRGLSREAPTPRPRDVRLLTGRAERVLRHRARPISEVFAGPGPAQYPFAP